jgi:hypothetical protein
MWLVINVPATTWLMKRDDEKCSGDKVVPGRGEVNASLTPWLELQAFPNVAKPSTFRKPEPHT